MLASWAYWKEGDLSFGAWVQSYRGHKCFVVSSWQDPRPAMFLAFRLTVIAIYDALVKRVPAFDRITRSVRSVMRRVFRPSRSRRKSSSD